MRPSVFPSPRLLVHALLVAACLAGCPAVPPATPEVPTPAPSVGPAGAEPMPAPSPSPSLRPGAPQDSPFLLFSDTFSAGAFTDPAGWTEAFAPAAAPAFHLRAEGDLTAVAAETRIHDALRAFPDAARVGLAFGAVDVRTPQNTLGGFTVSAVAVARAVLDAGRQPMFARIPWSPHARMSAVPSFNKMLGAIEAELGLAPGPDLQAWFQAHPEQLSYDGLAPTAEGQAAIRRLWAEALKRAETLPAPAARPDFKPSDRVFVAFGDSITYLSFLRTADWAGLFPAEVPAPEVRNFGMSGMTSRGALGAITSTIERNPDAGIVGLAFGTNDIALKIGDSEAFAANMRIMVTRIREAGRKPMLARIAWRGRPAQSVAEVAAYNGWIGAIEREFGLKPGPDLYAWFNAHRDEISADGVHPTPAGEASVRRLWAEALARAR